MSWQEEYKKKLIAPKDWNTLAISIKQRGLTLASINGSFDLMHAGHLHILHEASKQADCLIVALNSDSSIKQYKSEDRPIIPLKHRIEMMSAIQFVNFVTWFDETTPIRFLQTIKPHVHTNGAEYGKDCIERETVEENGGRVHIVELVPGLSTSEIINRIQGLCVS